MDKRRAMPQRRTGLRRTPIKRWSRPEADKVTPELHAYILDRDKVCIASRYDPEHVCRTVWGRRHDPDDRRYLTADHVKENAQMGGPRAPSDKYHLVAACGDANSQTGWCATHRAEEREHLRKVEPDE